MPNNLNIKTRMYHNENNAKQIQRYLHTPKPGQIKLILITLTY